MKISIPSFNALLALTALTGNVCDAAFLRPTADENAEHSNFNRNLQTLPPSVAQQIGIIGASIAALDPALAIYETPIQARFTNYYTSMWWNCIAIYSSDFKDSLTGARPAIVVQDENLYLTQNRALCATQATATYTFLSVPGALEAYTNTMSAIGVPVVDGIDADLAACAAKDTACYQSVAAAKGFTTEIMGMVVAKQTYDYAINDGFNELGTDDGCVVNCRPFRDSTGYTPKVSPYGKSPKGIKFAEAWKPLLEDNGSGFFYYQQHVTPHIGEKAKFATAMPEEDRTTRVARAPTYSGSRQAEAIEVIANMAELDDVKKIQVEVFDNKLLVAIAVLNSFVGKLLSNGYQDTELSQPGIVLSYERFIHFVNGFTATERDTVIIAWKEKVNYDLIRPTSVIKDLGDQLITTWAPGGIQTFPAKDFEAYKRVMPHSEYVSGSACIFEGIKDYVTGYMTMIGLDPTFPVAFDPIPAGSSNVEPGLVPASELTLVYPDIETMAEAGSQSRLDGGMHFGDSVPAALELCAGIGTFGVDHVANLLAESAA
ncbi:unnamed protein product [Cylindrotheca closterium]|uniref:Vanadium-dependent haloperoxidase NapH1-like second helical-bundle domain-containing protein n=1 Tax=Cylindrotheca closterium TaxID=2856 RepID=A0AAD2CGN1_9STRA|nr:unnamed protein product [Cylindrotheca closterium]